MVSPEVAMEALRIFTKPVNGQLVIDLPPSLKCDRAYEAIVPRYPRSPLSLHDGASIAEKLAGTVRLLDDLISPAT